ncbi:hypothetical protein V8C37DRAFT_400592 [Trichoderma ceciliae]
MPGSRTIASSKGINSQWMSSVANARNSHRSPMRKPEKGESRESDTYRLFTSKNSWGRLKKLEEDLGKRNDLSKEEPENLKEMFVIWEEYRKEVGIVEATQVAQQTNLKDKAIGPYAWIKYIGRLEITPKGLTEIVPTV